MVKTGEKPGKGEYECTKCKNNVSLDNETDKMPPCGKCHNSSFQRIG